MFYNMHPTSPNSEMRKDFEGYQFAVVALRDIEAGEEITRRYGSHVWRRAFEGVAMPGV